MATATSISTAAGNQALLKLYKSAFPIVAKYVSRKGGSFDEAKDVFQDALIIYYEKVITTGQLPNNEKAYLLGIAKNLWLKNFRESCRYISLEDAGNTAEIADTYEQQPLTSRLLNQLEASGQKCMDLLKSFYYDKLPMIDIAGRFGFSGERSATVQKFKCLESYEDFVE
jgi:DNA-directed RNA polymerase specialized sigma24 family protein